MCVEAGRPLIPTGLKSFMEVFTVYGIEIKVGTHNLYYGIMVLQHGVATLQHLRFNYGGQVK